MPRSPGRTGHAWRQLCAAVLAPDVLVCIRCTQLIDKALPHPHRMSKSVDHVVALVDGGAELDPANVGPAHLSCNSRHGAQRRNARRPQRHGGAWVHDGSP